MVAIVGLAPVLVENLGLEDGPAARPQAAFCGSETGAYAPGKSMFSRYVTR